MASVDVVVPSYNYARFLPRCVDSLLSQEGVDVRVLVLDDCSTDDTPAVARAITARDARVEYRRHEKNAGHIATYNEGLLGWARADYSLLISADDLLAPGALASAARMLDRQPDMGLCYGIAGIIFNDEDPGTFVATGAGDQVVSSAKFLERCFFHGNPVPTPTAIVRTRTQQEIGGYNAALPHTGDMEMWMRFAVHGPVGVLGNVLGYYRKHNASMSLQYYSRLLSDRREVIEACEDILGRWGQRFADSPRWRDGMRKRVAEDAFWAAHEAFSTGHADKVSACLDFARETWPAITRTTAWHKMRIKMLLGRPLAQRWSRLTGSGTPSASAPAVAPNTIGWWPAAE